MKPDMPVFGVVICGASDSSPLTSRPGSSRVPYERRWCARRARRISAKLLPKSTSELDLAKRYFQHRGPHNSRSRTPIDKIPVCRASKHQTQESVKTTSWQEKITCEIPADSQIAQVNCCSEVIHKQRPDGALVVAFFSRPARKRKRNQSESPYSGYSLTGRRQTYRKQHITDKIWNRHECKSSG